MSVPSAHVLLRPCAAWSLVALAGIGPAAAQDITGCAAIDDDAQRLRCYDARAGRPAATPAPAEASGVGQTPSPAPVGPAPSAATAAAPAGVQHTSALGRRWELDAGTRAGPFKLRPHRQNYLMPLLHTNAVNTAPYQPTLDALADAGLIEPTTLPVDATEARFQISLKVEVWEDLVPGRADLWLGYTQQSAWQVYNRENSSPFRNTDYAPEAMLAWRTDVDLAGLRWRVLTLGLLHESNGRADPLSRSWNRIYADFGLERGPFALSLRPWYRIPESAEKDDNPDLVRYMGYGDVVASYVWGGHQFGAVARHNFSSGFGAGQLDWSFPIFGALRGYAQVFSGYGYNLLDYNHRQTTVGLGFLLTDRL